MAKHGLLLLLDLDGVLVDFTTGAQRVHGKKIPLSEVRWGLEEQFGLDPDEFWKPMDHDLWAGLNWTVEGKELLSGIERMCGDRVVLMTKPCDTHGGVEGKVSWIKKHLPG